MDIATSLMVYFLIWWTVIFCVLPLGIKRNTGEHEGSGAPTDPQLKKKFLITTGVSALVWLLVYWMVTADVINFRDLSMQMVVDDYKTNENSNEKTP